jgi:hypothetical protein
LQNKKYTSTLQGLSVLDGKLNWLEKAPIVGCEEPSTVFSGGPEEEYPDALRDGSIENKKSPKRISRGRGASLPKTKFYPAKHIAVKIGNTTFIGLKEKDIIKPEQIKKLCNAIRDRKECRFGDRCKFLHQLPSQQKPNCKYGVKCGNNKCTFIHPDGKIEFKPHPSSPIKLDYPIQQKRNSSVKQKETGPSSQEETSFDTSSFRKIWLCKNIFKISTTSGSLYDCIKIEETGHCRFGDNCVYAHSTEQIRQNLELCRFNEECKGIKITQIKKDDKKVRRYENNPETRKCCRLHPKERVIDFIKRIQQLTERPAASLTAEPPLGSLRDSSAPRPSDRAELGRGGDPSGGVLRTQAPPAARPFGRAARLPSAVPCGLSSSVIASRKNLSKK